MSKRVLILSLIFPPDGVSSAQLLGEIAEDLDRDGIEVEVITTTPHYNIDSAAQAEQPMRWKWHRLSARSTFKGMPVLHLRMPAKSGGSIGRITQWIWFHLGSAVAIAGRRRKYHSILTISPPPTVAIVGGLAAKLTKARLVFCVWELYPEILVALNVVERSSLLHRALRVLEGATYRLADTVAVLHEPMREQIGHEFPQFEDKVHVVPTFADVDFLKPLSHCTNLRKECQLDEFSIVFGYAGNLGASEDLRPVLEAAELVPDAAFLVSGDGSERTALEELAGDRMLRNVVFTGQLPYARMPEVIGTCDVALVVLAPGLGHEALPSKAYRTMACGRPILAVCDSDTPLAHLVLDHGIGLVAPPEYPDQIAAAAQKLGSDAELRAAMGERARRVAVDQFSRDAVTSKYRDLLIGGPHDG